MPFLHEVKLHIESERIKNETNNVVIFFIKTCLLKSKSTVLQGLSDVTEGHARP